MLFRTAIARKKPVLPTNARNRSLSLEISLVRRRNRRGKQKRPNPSSFNITLAEPGPFAFAGIWDAWKRPDGTYLETFALVTTEPNELVAQIHDRLALILHPRDYDRWLGIDDKGGDPRPPLDLLHPYDADKMVMKPANPAVGNWRNNGPEMLDRT